MTKPSKKGRVVREGVHVSATTTARGHSATSIHVQVDRAKLERQTGEPADIEQVVVEVPEQTGSRDVEWRSETVPRLSSQAQPATPGAQGGPATVLDTYTQTLYGPCDVGRYGVSVSLETPTGTLLAQAPGETYSAHPVDEPEPAQPLHKLEPPQD